MNGWGKIIAFLAALLTAVAGGMGLAARMGALEGRMDTLVAAVARVQAAVEQNHTSLTGR